MSDWIGLLATLAFLFYVLLRQRPSKEPQEQEDTLKEFLNSLNEDMQAKKKPALPIPKKEMKPHVMPEAPKQGIVSAYFEKGTHYEVIGKEAPSRGQRMLQTLQDKRNMVIFHEIIGPPKCKRR